MELNYLTGRVGKVCGLNVEELRLALFNQWIKSTTAADNNTHLLASERYQINSSQQGHQEHQLHQQLLQLLSSFDSQASINLLLKIAYDKSPRVQTLQRIRALCLLFQVASDEDIQQVHDCGESRRYLLMLFYLLDCEELRISVRSRELYEIDKAALARSLWLTRSHEPKVSDCYYDTLITRSYCAGCDICE